MLSAHKLILSLLTVTSLVWASSGFSAGLLIGDVRAKGVSSRAYFQEQSQAEFDVFEANRLYLSGAFTDSDKVLNLGIDQNPIWLSFDFSNRSDSAMLKRLSVKTPWLDKLDVYFLRDGKLDGEYHVGDSFVFSQRETANRYFVFDHYFSAGVTRVLIRAETVESMLLPVYLDDIQQADAGDVIENYSYGFFYGGMIALLAYNLILFFSLGSQRYFYYSLYIAAFCMLNAAYTGHALMWLWPNSPGWQGWAVAVLLTLSPLTGLLFATNFLNTRQALPRLHRIVVLIGAGFFCAELFAIVMGYRVLALGLSFSLVFVYSGLMVLLGSVAFASGNKSAKFFLLGSVTHVLASSAIILVVWGFVPYSLLAYRANEWGMLIDGVLLALALADKFRLVQEEKIRADVLSRLDPLTSLNNRRAFYDFVNPVWERGLIDVQSMSVILLDVDKFKGINDNYGHSQGDRVLVLIANLLSEEIRPCDYLARWGGEEFVIFLPETHSDTAVAIAERLRENIAAMDLPDALASVSLTVSLGVAENDQGNQLLSELISAADKYLYHAKDTGRNQVCGGLLSAASLNNPLHEVGALLHDG